MEAGHYNNIQATAQNMAEPSAAAALNHMYPLVHHHPGVVSQNGGSHHYQPRMHDQAGPSTYTLLQTHTGQTVAAAAYDDNHHRAWRRVVPVKTEPADHTGQGVQRLQTTNYMRDEGSESVESIIPMALMAPSQVPSGSGQTFVACRVCGDKASGYHYGVTSCEGCKGFFRRSMQKRMEYRCLREGKCQVMRLNRNRCQYCRFKKCIAVGMSKDSVRYGRVPKRSAAGSEEQAVTSSPFGVLSGHGQFDRSAGSFGSVRASPGDDGESLAAEAAAAAMEARSMLLSGIIMAVSHAHSAHCDETEENMAVVERRIGTLVPGSECDSNGNGKPADEAEEPSTSGEVDLKKCKTFQNLADLVTPSINKAVEFAKRIPDFHTLSPEDQLTLVKAGFFEMWLIRCSRLFDIEDGTLMFHDGTCIPRSDLDVIYGEELVDRMFEFANQFVNLRLNDTEIGLFTCVALISPDRPGISDHSTVRALSCQVTEAFALQLHRNHPLYPGLSTTALTVLLPSLRIIGSEHDRILDNYRNWWQSLKLPPLFAEVYDFSKVDEQSVEVSEGAQFAPQAGDGERGGPYAEGGEEEEEEEEDEGALQGLATMDGGRRAPNGGMEG